MHPLSMGDVPMGVGMEQKMPKISFPESSAVLTVPWETLSAFALTTPFPPSPSPPSPFPSCQAGESQNQAT